MHPFHYQQLEPLQILQQHFHEESELGTMIRQSWEAMILEAGMSGHMTSWNYEELNECITDCWLKSTWQYCWNNNISIEDGMPELPLKRTNDALLMDVFIHKGKFKNKDLKLLNQCRTYLKVTTVSDISSADGKRLLPGVIDGDFQAQEEDKYKWPRQPDRLTSDHWNIWKQALQLTLCNAYDNAHSLRTPLGAWLKDPSTSRTWYYNANTYTLYKQHSSGWHVYTSPRQPRPGSTFKRANRTTSQLPPHSRPADAWIRTADPSTVIFGSHYAQVASQQPADPAPADAPELTLHQCLLPSDSPNHWATKVITQRTKGTDGGKNVAQAIRQGKAKAICDGSYKHHKGTAGFCVHGDNDLFRIMGSNCTPGRTCDQSPYRSELGGVVGTLELLKALCKAHKIRTGAVTVGIDCESAIKTITADNPPPVHASQWDMINECRQLLKELPIQVTFRWIEGHQDEKGKPKHSLDWWARQNIRMDQRAKMHLRKHEHTPLIQTNLAHEMLPVWIGDAKMTHFPKELIHELTCTKVIKRYWCRKDSISPEQYESINWTAAKKSLQEAPRGMQRFHGKFASRHIGVGRMMKIRKEWGHSRCPLCGCNEETTQHVIQCPDARATKVWNSSMEDLNTWLKEQGTEPTLHKLIIRNLNQWRQGRRCWTGTEGDPHAIRAIRGQGNIGWFNALLGRQHSLMETVQEHRYQSKRIRKSGHRWAVVLNKKFRTILWNMWEHRNSILHGTTDNFHAKMVTAAVDKDIAQDFRNGKLKILKGDKYLFKSKKQLLKQPLLVKQRWLDRVTGARKAWRAHQLKGPSLLHEQIFMANHLGRQLDPLPPPPPAEPPPPPPQLPTLGEQQGLATWLGQTPPSTLIPATNTKPRKRKRKAPTHSERALMTKWRRTAAPLPDSNKTI